MKKMLVVAGLMLAGVCASAQNYFGVTGGYNLSNHFISEWNLTSIDPIEGGVSYDYYCKSGFNAGLSFEHRFAPKSNGGNWFLGVSALYSLEGYNIRSEIVFAIVDLASPTSISRVLSARTSYVSRIAFA